MGSVIVGLSISLDGFIAGANDGPDNPLGDGGDRLFTCMSAGPAENRVNAYFTPPDASRVVIDEWLADCGAIVSGRRTFDIAAGWRNGHPIDVPIFVVTHEPPTAGDWSPRVAFEFPNGMAATPDNSTLIVAESYAKRLTAFDIGAGGDLSNRRVWAEIDGYPDGICLDADNAVWCAAMLRCQRVGEGGRVLQDIELDRSCFACMLGGPEHRTLFMMAAEWSGPEGMTAEARTGQVLAAAAPTP